MYLCVYSQDEERNMVQNRLLLLLLNMKVSFCSAACQEDNLISLMHFSPKTTHELFLNQKRARARQILHTFTLCFHLHLTKSTCTDVYAYF